MCCVFYFFKFIFNWRIIALQYCVVFCHTSAWISHSYVPPSSTSLPPPTPSYTSRLSQSTSLSSLSHTANSHWLSILHSLEENYDQARQHTKKQRHYFAHKGLSSQSYGFSSSHVWMWELDYKESWAPKNWSFWTVVLEKTLESPLDSKEIQPVNPKGNQSWISL